MIFSLFIPEVISHDALGLHRANCVPTVGKVQSKTVCETITYSIPNGYESENIT